LNHANLSSGINTLKWGIITSNQLKLSLSFRWVKTGDKQILRHKFITCEILIFIQSGGGVSGKDAALKSLEIDSQRPPSGITQPDFSQQ